MVDGVGIILPKEEISVYAEWSTPNAKRTSGLGTAGIKSGAFPTKIWLGLELSLRSLFTC